MSRRPAIRLLHLAATLALAGQLALAQAVELGEVTARSYIGQPLVADIELTSLANPNAPVQVDLASPDVYLAANVAMTPVLAGLAMVVERRGGRQILHIRSPKAVEAPHVHLFFELGEGANRVVRTVTVWLSPNPKPVAATVVAPLPAGVKPAPIVVKPRPFQSWPRPATSSAPKTVEVVRPDNEAGLRYQNGVLTAKLTEVEEKMKLLQTSLGVQAEGAAPPVALAVEPPIKLVKPVAARPAKAVTVATVKKAPWLWIVVSGLVLLLVAAAGVFLYFRHRDGQAGEGDAAAATQAADAAEAGPSLWSRLRERLRRRHWAEGADLPAEAI